jgi:hypothetical protein
MEGASHSHGAPRGKRGKFNFLAKGLFALFNMLRKDAREREADRQWLAQELHRQEKIQKDMAGRLNLPHSPVHEIRTFDPPSPVPNPWEDLGSWVSVDDDEEEDYGVRRRSTTRTTRSGSLFGACYQRGSEFGGWKPLSIFIYLVSFFI